MRLYSIRVKTTAIGIGLFLGLLAVLTAAEAPKIPTPWSEVLQPAYGPWQVVAIWQPYQHSKPAGDMASLIAAAAKPMEEAKGQVKPSYTEAESKGKCLPVYYESAPRKQICVATARHANAAAAEAAYKKDVARTLNPGSAEILDYRVVKDGQHKDAAGKVLGSWTLLESNFPGQFAEKAFWTQGDYLFSAETTIRDFRIAEVAPRSGPTPAWEQIKTDAEKEQFLRGAVENFLSVALKR